jgi:uncharacterized protein YndB with AHSA1/START domain
MSGQETRRFEMAVEVAVSPDAVWQALTDADDLVRWFPLDANITPGVGGKWLVSWDGQWPWNTAIEIWEPKRHLRLVDRKGRPYDAEGRTQAAVTPMEIAIDWYIEGRGGTTTVRLVHSGFGRGGAWDDEYDGVSVGWQLELRSLKHYLEHHRGHTRRVVWNRAATSMPLGEVWNRLTDDDGILGDARVRSAHAGDRYSTKLATGDRIEGTVAVTLPGRAIQMTVEGWNNGLYRLWLDRVAGESLVNSWLSVYDVPVLPLDEFKERMQHQIDRVTSVAAPRSQFSINTGVRDVE